jgi:UDP-2,3-diacylglucosamine pyrophosphatase LpxH
MKIIGENMDISNEQIYKTLRNLSPATLPTNADLYRKLQSLELGTFEGLKSRYKRDTDGFRDIINEWREGYESNVSQYTEYTPPVEQTVDEYVKDREAMFAETQRQYIDETQRHLIRVGKTWGIAMLFADTHAEASSSDIGLLVNTIKFFDQFPTVHIFNGDLGDFFTSAGPWGNAIAVDTAYHNQLRINNAITAMDKLLPLLNLKAFIEGNHDAFLNNAAKLDITKMKVHQYHPDCLYRRISATIKFITDDNESDWIKFQHQVPGRSSINLHGGPNKHVLSMMPHDVSWLVTGHYHWPVASMSQSPFPNKTVRSILLGSIKSFDDYSMSLGHESNRNESPFAFVFVYDGVWEVITDLDVAKKRAKHLERIYG